jgi:hypothetical protein
VIVDRDSSCFEVGKPWVEERIGATVVSCSDGLWNEAIDDF